MSACGVICHCRCWEAPVREGGWIPDDEYDAQQKIQRVCGTCNEPEFSEYAANCRAHTPDNMIEA